MAVISLSKTTILCGVPQKLEFNRLKQKVVRSDAKRRSAQYLAKRNLSHKIPAVQYAMHLIACKTTW
jgi:hypothetical protein